tara:strand:+ start:2762 stop:3601 length:840 start_codon:yes stop_codon:yes gene_type:complete
MKVLSIDIDFCFPNVEEWPNEDGELWDEWHPATKWTNYFSKYPDLNCRENIVQENCLDYMLDTFTKALVANPDVTVAFGWDHDYILDSILDFEDIELVNIDHHDDFLAGCYIEKVQEELDDYTNETFLALHLLEYHHTTTYGKVDEGSWGAYLHALGKLKSMTWIHNGEKAEEDSRSSVNRYICNNVGKYCEWGFKEPHEYDHGDYKYDHIFVCLSPGYFPMSQWELFGIFLGIYEDHTGKSCNIGEWWDQRYINKMAYRSAYDIVKPAMENVKRSLAK